MCTVLKTNINVVLGWPWLWHFELLSYFWSYCNEIWIMSTVLQTHINIDLDMWLVLPTFYFLKLQQCNVDHVYSFENKYQCCLWMTLTVTFWPTFVFIKIQQWNLGHVYNFTNSINIVLRLPSPWLLDFLSYFWRAIVLGP